MKEKVFLVFNTAAFGDVLLCNSLCQNIRKNFPSAKIVFIADKIEPNTRDDEYSAKIRDLLSEENGLNKALLKCYKETIKSLVKRDLKICLLTIKIYNKLQDLVQN